MLIRYQISLISICTWILSDTMKYWCQTFTSILIRVSNQHYFLPKCCDTVAVCVMWLSCDSAWLKDEEDPLIRSISLKSAALSNLTLTTVEELQVRVSFSSSFSSSSSSSFSSSFSSFFSFFFLSVSSLIVIILLFYMAFFR